MVMNSGTDDHLQTSFVALIQISIMLCFHAFLVLSWRAVILLPQG